MPTTTNFGWTTPADTDLVKDGAAAIRTLAGNIDTSLVDLKGGTTNQVLAKNSNTDLDFTWVAQDDSNAIQNAIIDAKGDLIVGSAADTPARIAVGANNTILTADSSTATGLKWATPAVAGANWSLLNSGGTTLSGTETTVSGISGADKIMVIVEQASTSGGTSSIDIRVNTSTSSIYNYAGLQLDAPSSYTPGGVFSDIKAFGNAQGIPIGKMSTSASSRVTAGLTMTGANASGLKAFQSVGAANPFGSNDAIMYILQGWFDTSSTISSVSVVSQGTSFDAGKVYIYTSA